MSDQDRYGEDAPPTWRGEGAGGENPRVDSRTLMGKARRLVIEHEGQEYLLQVTRAGRLILTK